MLFNSMTAPWLKSSKIMSWRAFNHLKICILARDRSKLNQVPKMWLRICAVHSPVQGERLLQGFVQHILPFYKGKSGNSWYIACFILTAVSAMHTTPVILFRFQTNFDSSISTIVGYSYRYLRHVWLNFRLVTALCFNYIFHTFIHPR